MATASLVQVFGAAHIRLTVDGQPIAVYTINWMDGPSPVEAATAVLAANGWEVVGGWTRIAEGASGGEWEGHVELAVDDLD
jgi:hypothetical protein